MKKILLLVAAALVCAGCTSRQQKALVAEAAQGYLEAVGNYRFDEAVPYSSSYTAENTLDVFRRMMRFTDTAYISSNTPAEITVTGVKMLSGSEATAYYHKHTPTVEQDDSVTVVKEEGRWLVDVRVQVPAILTFYEMQAAMIDADSAGK